MTKKSLFYLEKSKHNLNKIHRKKSFSLGKSEKKKKCLKMGKKGFQLAYGYKSTQKLVKIHNICN